MACQVAKLSQCHRAQYGSVIVAADGSPVAWGYNGKPAGCGNDGVCYREGLPPNAPKAKCCLHSEQNALVFADQSRAKGGTFYVNGFPCEDCALLIVQSGVDTLVCMTDTRGYPGLEVLGRYQAKLAVLIYPHEEVTSYPNPCATPGG
jgi:dCMP deaminase